MESPSKNVIFPSGLGDVLAMESVMSAREIDSCETVYWATRAEPYTRPLFERSERWGKKRHVHLDAPKVFFFKEAVLKDYPDLPADLEWWGIYGRFAEWSRRAFRRSTFLTEPLASVDHLDLPDRFIACQHETPINTPEQRAYRDITGEEWAEVIRRLEVDGVPLVVLNSADANPPPRHDLVIDLVGKTSTAESLSVLSRAEGYWGIASSLCVAAAQLFPAGKLWVKGVEAWLFANRFVYFAPHLTFPFLYKSFTDKEPVRLLNRGEMLYRMKCMRIVKNRLVSPGSIVEMTPKEAAGFVRTGQAEVWTGADSAKNRMTEILEMGPKEIKEADDVLKKKARRAIRLVKEKECG